MEPRVSPTAGEEATWLASSAARLTAIRRELALSSGGPIPKSQARPPRPHAEGSAHGSVAPFIEGGVLPRGQPEHPQEELAALRLGRTAPISFAVTRHAMMIAGRPVVVPREKKNTPSPFLRPGYNPKCHHFVCVLHALAAQCHQRSLSYSGAHPDARTLGRENVRHVLGP